MAYEYYQKPFQYDATSLPDYVYLFSHRLVIREVLSRNDTRRAMG